jgi:site-specific recombinase XerD
VEQRSTGDRHGTHISVENGKLFVAYRAFEELRGHTVQGMASTLRGVKKLLGFLESQGLEACTLKLKDALSYQGFLQEQCLSRTTVLFGLYAAGSFYAYLKRSGRVAHNPFAEIRKPRREKHLPAGLLKEAQMGEFLSELARFDRGARLTDRLKAYRAHVVAEFLYATGIRASEAAGVRLEDIDFVGGLLRVREGKGGVTRMAVLGVYAAAVVKLYVERMRPLVLNGKNAGSRELLFGVKWNSFGECMNSVFRACARRLGFPKTTCHLFRHAVGYHLLRAGCNIRYIQDILGHKELRSTELYTRVDTEDLRDVVDRFHPRRWTA